MVLAVILPRAILSECDLLGFDAKAMNLHAVTGVGDFFAEGLVVRLNCSDNVRFAKRCN